MFIGGAQQNHGRRNCDTVRYLRTNQISGSEVEEWGKFQHDMIEPRQGTLSYLLSLYYHCWDRYGYLIPYRGSTVEIAWWIWLAEMLITSSPARIGSHVVKKTDRPIEYPLSLQIEKGDRGMSLGTF